ncbi:MAG TPA: hypothetical protein VHE12_04425 [bacterium]|nr:hypothetical protein [bacterium]
MNTLVETYLAYLFISITLTVWVARVLFKHGGRFLVDAMSGDVALADSWNHLLVVGFYLINFGYVAFNLKVEKPVETIQQAIEVLAAQIGLVLMMLGIMHFFNLYVFNKVRRKKDLNPELNRKQQKAVLQEAAE